MKDINKFGVVLVELFMIIIIIVAKLDKCPFTLKVAIVDNPLDLLSLHFETIVLLVAVGAFIFKKKVDERLLDISYKFWIVKTVRGNISVLSLVVLIASQFLWSSVSCFIGVLIPQYIFYIFSLVLLAILYYQLYSVTSKKSILYQNIMKKLLTNNEKLAKEIMKKWAYNYSDYASNNTEEKKKKHNSYIEEELLIGFILFCKYSQLKKRNNEETLSDNIYTNDFVCIIKNRCKMILKEDNRKIKDVINYLCSSRKYYDREDAIILYINDKIPYRTKYDFIKWTKELEIDKMNNRIQASVYSR